MNGSRFAAPIPTPLAKILVPNLSVREWRESFKVIEPGAAVPETTAPKSVEAPIANRLSNDTRPFGTLPSLSGMCPRGGPAQGTVGIRFIVNRAGIVLSSAIVAKSCCFDLDRAAMDTLQRAQPLPAIPSDVPDEVELSVPLEFYLKR